MRWRQTAAVALAVTGAAVAPFPLVGFAQPSVPACTPGGPPVTFSGSVLPADARTYLVRPFDVAAGTTRVEITYDWADEPLLPGLTLPSTPLTQTVFDLGLWDNDGYRSADGFRGWSGSRGGRASRGQAPVFVQQDTAARGYLPDPIEPGIWWVEIGVAAVGPTGATWEATITCSAPAVGAPFVSQPVDPHHVVATAPGWHHGDFHFHGFHSNARAPSWNDELAYARSVGLDIVPVTDYVTTQHWRELGPVQDANPDVLVVPSREIITYFGHATAFGETPHAIDYRHGFEDVTLGAIQAGVVAEGCLFGVAHPTTFPGPLFANFCRGCAFDLSGSVDWRNVTTIEVLTGPILASSTELGLPGLPVTIQNPFTQPAIDLWEYLLLQGHRITGISGSDSKGVEGEPRRLWGTNATAVYTEELSQAGLADALRAGHAYVRTRGVHNSPAVTMTAVTPDGQRGMFGDSLAADRAEVTVTVTGGQGQLLQVTRDGLHTRLPVLITSDPFTYTFTAKRHSSSGPLGTFFRVDTLDLQSLTTIGNPIFLTGPGGASSVAAVTDPEPSAFLESKPADSEDLAAKNDVVSPSAAPASGRRTTLPATGRSSVLPAAGLGLLLAATLLNRTHVRLTWATCSRRSSSGSRRCSTGASRAPTLPSPP